ncbi:GDSL-type esterase/lipase family protein [Niabella pedocola]|uniref:GDSL-type esterase/lipase family protein n=1 Tax=Niabella pedocola TaxID=1752077 RepID=A0ABS8PMX3_9BACT|nr:GDSL-type esterase/lipase family protein [Niabella pedocola]MCD2422450.1 GDSL-type esterase/lipase family protein [Niabella pedocola]
MKKLFLLTLLIFLAIPGNGQNRRSLTIVTFGNSTTARRAGVQKVYAQRLHEQLDSLGIANTVINSGVPSSHSGSIKDNSFAKVIHAMDRFDTAVLKHHPDWVTINFGLNDAYQDKGVGTPSRIPLKQFKKNIRYFIRQIEKQGGKVILLTPNPLGSRFEQFRYDRVKAYADAIRKIARKKHLPLVDSWLLFYNYSNALQQPLDALFTDSIHPNDNGHQLIATALAQIISGQQYP